MEVAFGISPIANEVNSLWSLVVVVFPHFLLWKNVGFSLLVYPVLDDY